MEMGATEGFMRAQIEQLEEENKKLEKEIENHKQNIMQDELEIIPKLEEENKNLKSDLAYERTMLDNVRAEYKSLQNINKKLNINVASLEGEIKGLNSTIEKLKEENQTLELWLDNKEKLNEEYRKLISKIDQLEEENENLRKDLFHLTNNGKSK